MIRLRDKQDDNWVHMLQTESAARFLLATASLKTERRRELSETRAMSRWGKGRGKERVKREGEVKRGE